MFSIHASKFQVKRDGAELEKEIRKQTIAESSFGSKGIAVFKNPVNPSCDIRVEVPYHSANKPPTVAQVCPK